VDRSIEDGNAARRGEHSEAGDGRLAAGIGGRGELECELNTEYTEEHRERGDWTGQSKMETRHGAVNIPKPETGG